MKTLFLILILFLSCDRNNSVKTYSIAKEVILEKKSNQTSSKSSHSFTWNAPSHWKEGKSSSMRLASYSIPYNDAIADLSITNFSGDGGGLLANVNRWRQQLDLEPYGIAELDSDIIIGNSQIGEFRFIKITNNENIENAFLCSIYSIDKSTIFIKMSASINGVNELENDFKEFCSTLRYNDK